MAVGHVASASSGSQASVASFNIGTLGTGARAGIVFVCTHNSSTDIVTGVTWNGSAMSLLYSATDTDTEPGRVEAYFLDNVTNGLVTVSRTNNATVTVGYAASISATGKTAVLQTITRVSSTQNTNADTSTTGTGASGEVAVTDGTRPTNSLRYAAYYSGAATPPAAGTNSTGLQVLDSTAFGSRFVRETTAGTGSRNVGAATGTTDDWALVAVVVSEIDVTATGAISVPAPTVSGTGTHTPNPSGTGAITVPSATVAGTGSHIQNVTGTGAVSVPAPTVAGTGAERFTATGAVTVPPPTVAGTGAERFTATGAVTVPTVTVAGTGAERFTATGAVSVPAPTVAGTGNHEAPMANPEGTGAISVPSATVAGTGALILTATGVVSVPAATVAGTGAERFTATGAITGQAPTVAGTGSHAQAVTGTGAILAGPVVIAGTGTHLQNVTGTGAITVQAATVAGTGSAPSGGHGARGGPVRLPDLPSPDADEAYLLVI